MLVKRLHYLLQPVIDQPKKIPAVGKAVGPVVDRRRLRTVRQYALPLLLLMAIATLLIVASPHPSLMAFDEGIYAQQARWMQAKGDWITVGWWGAPEYDHGVGFTWLMALSQHWVGSGEGAIRLPSLLASGLAILLTWRLGKHLSVAGGLWGAAILAVLPIWMQASKLGTPDVVLACLGLATIWTLLRAEASARRRVLWGFGVGVLLNASFLVSGSMVLLPTLSLLPYLIQDGRHHHHLSNRGLYWGLGLGAIPALIWLGQSVMRYGWWTLQRILRVPFGKLSETLTGSVVQPLMGDKTAFYYLWHVPLVTFPWIILAVIGAVLVRRNSLVQRQSLWLGYPLVYLALLSLVHDRSDYLALPVYPFIALLAGVGIDYLGRLFCSPRPRHYRVAAGFGWGLGVLAILLISAGGALVVAPGELVSEDIKLLGWIAVALGLGWLVPWLITVNRDFFSPRGRIDAPIGTTWQLGWLLGPWIAIALLCLTGLWGNYSPELKTALQTLPIAPVLEQNAIHFIQPRKDQEDVLLSIYTPHLGDRYSNWQDVPSGEYAWGNSQAVPLPDETYQVVGNVEGWQLVKAP